MTFTFYESSQNFVHCRVHVSDNWKTRPVDSLAQRNNKTYPKFIHLSFSDRSFTAAFPLQIQPHSLNSHHLHKADGHFCWWIPTQLSTKFPFHCKHTLRFVIRERAHSHTHTHSFLRLIRHFPQLRCKRHWWQDLKPHVERFKTSFILHTRLRLIIAPLLSSSQATLH